MSASRAWGVHRAHAFLSAGMLIAAAAAFIVASPALAESRASDVIPNHYIVMLRNSVEHPGAVAEAQTEKYGGDLGFVYRHGIEGYSAVLSKTAVETLRENPKVRYVVADRMGKFTSQTTPTGIARIFAPQIPALDIDEIDDVRVDADVAIIDSGIDYSHPDLNIAGRTDCTIGNQESCVDGQGTDEFHHGTHVAGIVGAIDNGFGAVGVAPGVRLWSVRVGNQVPSSSATIAGVQWVTAHASQIEAVNMSLEIGGYIAPLEEAIDKSVEAGVVYAVAAGNSHKSVASAPASFDEVITVSAVSDYDGLPGGSGQEVECQGGGVHFGADDRLASYSNWGPPVDIAAPGSCIYSTLPGGTYNLSSGTSMAAPHVAGAAAILASESNPNSKTDVEAIKQKLITEGSLNWVDNSGDGIHEPLLDLRPPAREADTFAASKLQPHSAQLNGVASAGGSSATYRFEYGATTEYGSSAPASPQSIGSGTGDVEVSQQISIKPGVTYHYRLAVTNGGGTSYGADQEFKTSSWVVQPTPKPSGEQLVGTTRFRDISCISSVECIGVGFSSITEGQFNYEVNFAEGWNGTEWTVQSTPAPVEGITPRLESVSCTSSTFCMALGYSSVKSHRRPFALRWNGSEWATVAAMPLPAGLVSTGNLSFGDISCTSSTSCVAVGGYPLALSGGKPSEEKTLVESWNGSEWAIVSSPNPAGKALNALAAVSCPTATSCTAVGKSVTSLSVKESTALAMGWDGGKWSLQVVPGGEEAGSDFADVSCPSIAFCMAVGGLAELWNGSEWSPRLNGYSGAGMTDVACASEISCAAIGNDLAGRRWNGVEWTPLDTAPPEGKPQTHLKGSYQEGGTSVVLNGVSCPSMTACSTVGSFTSENDGTVPLAERLTPQWPVVTVEPATSVTSAAATLRGSINPEGFETTYQFEYGPTTSYGQVVPLEAKSVGKGTANVEVSQAISGLKPFTQYHFRIVATNSEGTSYGVDRSFTTGLPLHWYGCTKQAGGKYSNSTCLTEGSPKEWESARLKEAEKTTITAKGNPIALSSTQASKTGTLSCETEVVGASLENPSGAGPGIGQAEVKFKGCKVEGGWENCKAETTANFPSKLELMTLEGKARAVLAPTAGSTFANFNFTGCKKAELNGAWSLTGTLNGIYSNAGSKIEFTTETTASGLTLRGQKATAVGSIGLETTGGGYVKAEAEVHWYGCTKQAGGKYSSSACLTEGSPNEWEPIRLKEAEKTTIAAKGNPIVLSSTQSTKAGGISCETEVLGASLENPGGGGNGIGNAEVKFKGCKADPAWESCVVETTANFPSKLELTTVEGKGQIRLIPSSGSTFANFNFTGCKKAELNGAWSLTGTLNGIYSNAGSKIEFTTETTASGLTMRGQKATAAGSIGLETSGGGSIAAR